MASASGMIRLTGLFGSPLYIRASEIVAIGSIVDSIGARQKTWVHTRSGLHSDNQTIYHVAETPEVVDGILSGTEDSWEVRSQTISSLDTA